MAKAEYRRATLPDTADTATRLVHLASECLLTGRTRLAVRCYKAAALYAHDATGARELRLMAAELEFGLMDPRRAQVQ